MVRPRQQPSFLTLLASVTDTMKQDRTKWNEKYREDHYPAEVAGVVKDFYGMAPGKMALDIAAGNGRHAIYLARKGFSVDAVDISEVGLGEFAGQHPNIRAICADLDHFDIPAGRYDLILNVKFLNRRLFPYILEGLKPGGVVIFHTLLKQDAVQGTSKHCGDYLLRPNELLHAFIGMRVVYYRESASPETDDPDWTATFVGVKK